MKVLIDFFASIYDLAYNFLSRLVDFFAALYDLVYDFIIFMIEYIKWITDFRSNKTNNSTIQAEKTAEVKKQPAYNDSKIIPINI